MAYAASPAKKVMAGTEHRDQYRTFFDATLTATNSSATKPVMDPGPCLTSTSMGHPWVQPIGPEDTTWRNTGIVVPGIDPAGHFRTTSNSYGSMASEPFHRHTPFEKAKVAGNVRYLQAPYLVGEMAAGAGIDARPVSSVSTFSLASERQAEILAGGEMRLGERLAQTAAFTHSRSLKSAPISPLDEYLTTTNASYTSRPLCDSQQHRLRMKTTSSFVPARTLDSAPAYCATPALAGGGTMHATRFVGVRDSDGGRRLIELDTTGKPAATNPWKMPTDPTLPPEPPPSIKYVSSQPFSHHNDAERAFLYGDVDASSTSLPRRPWPAEQAVPQKYRRPFAMGFQDGLRSYNEFKIQETKRQVAAEEAADAAYGAPY